VFPAVPLTLAFRSLHSSRELPIRLLIHQCYSHLPANPSLFFNKHEFYDGIDGCTDTLLRRRLDNIIYICIRILLLLRLLLNMYYVLHNVIPRSKRLRDRVCDTVRFHPRTQSKRFHPEMWCLRFHPEMPFVRFHPQMRSERFHPQTHQ